VNPYQIIRRPIVTEKAVDLARRENQYTFEVDMRANKRMIAEAIEEIFDVDVLKVRTMIMPGKTRRWGRRISKTRSWKKAIVTLAPGDTIEVFHV
jgi:large subunit ribosomal protein L23